MASKSEYDLDEEADTETVRRPWYKRFAFWRAALPTMFSLLSLAAALTLLLVPQTQFTTTVRRLPTVHMLAAHTQQNVAARLPGGVQPTGAGHGMLCLKHGL